MAEKLGLVAGGGSLPVTLAERCQASGRPFFVIRLKGMADEALNAFPGADVGLAELGRCLETLKREKCRAVCFAGVVKRPDFKTMKPDFRGLLSLPGAIAAAAKGDDAILRFFIGEFEKEGFVIKGAESVAGDLTLGAEPLGRHRPLEAHRGDIDLAIRAARATGALDIGQAVVVAGGTVLAVEAQEGTDAMLARCATLPALLKGTAEARLGVLVKWPKPGQERRVDLPVIGVSTVEGAAAAGLAGIVGEVGGALVLDRDAVAARADALGLFVIGVEAGAAP